MESKIISLSLDQNLNLVEGFSLTSFNNKLYIIAKEGFFYCDSSTFKLIDLPLEHKVQKANNMVQNDKFLYIILKNKKNKRVLSAWDGSKWDVFTNKHSFLPEGSYLGVKKNILYLGLEDDKVRQLYAFNGSTFSKIQLPQTMSMATAANFSPAWYCPYTMISFHAGLHIVFTLEDKPAVPFSFKGLDKKGAPILEEWVGVGNKTLIAGTQIACNDYEDTLISYFKDKDKMKMYYHKGHVGLVEVVLPEGYKIQKGFPSLGFQEFIYLILVSHKGQTDLFKYSKPATFQKVSLPKGVHLFTNNAMCRTDDDFYFTAKKDNDIVLLSIV